jgi:hypothetical protein
METNRPGGNMTRIDRIRSEAIDSYRTDTVDIAEDANVEWAEDGAWVEARVWVPELEDPATRSDVTIYGAGSQ